MTAAGMALNPPGDIVEITIFSGSLYAVCFLPAVLFGLYWEKGTARSVLWSMLLGTVVLLLWILLGLKQTLHEVVPALLVSIITYYWLASSDDAVIHSEHQSGSAAH